MGKLASSPWILRGMIMILIQAICVTFVKFLRPFYNQDLIKSSVAPRVVGLLLGHLLCTTLLIVSKQVPKSMR